jgi:ribonucleotide monophosphatase NagD (HAD superfamily)
MLQVHEEQVVMAHSPLRMFQQYHNKHVLISGQGPIVEIAKNLGFKKIVTIDEMRCTFPMLDAVDHKRRISVVSFITICTVKYLHNLLFSFK